MTLNEAAYYIAGTLNRPEDDVFIAEIKFAIKYYRTKLLRDDFNRNGIDKNSVQSFVVPLIDVDKSLTHLIEFDCDIKRTTDKVPIPIKTKTNSPFLFIGGVGFSRNISYIETNQIMNLKHDRFASTHVKYFYENGYVYLINAKRIKLLQFQSYWENPEEVIDLIVSDNNCYNDDQPFPLRQDLLMFIVNGILENRMPINVHNDGETRLLKTN